MPSGPCEPGLELDATTGNTCTCQTITSCEHACDLGTAVGCAQAGVGYAQGKYGATIDADRSDKFYRRACDKAFLKACVELTYNVYNKNSQSGSPAEAASTYSDGMALAKKACDGGEQGGCAMIGAFLYDGHGGENDHARAITLATTACKASDEAGCFLLGRDDIKRAAWSEAVQHLRVSCDAADPMPNACFKLGTVYAQHPPTKDPFDMFAQPSNTVSKSNEQLATEAYARACDPTHKLEQINPKALPTPHVVDGCVELAMALRAGRGATKDMNASHALFAVACDEGNGIACAQLGADYLTGDGVARDVAAGLKLSARACELKVADACSNVAAAQGAQDPAAAVASWEKACELGSDQACVLACDASVGPMCMKAALMLDTTNHKRALELMAKACALDVEGACTWVLSHPR